MNSARPTSLSRSSDRPAAPGPAALRPALGEDTQAELVLAMATLGEDTIAPGEEADTFDTEQSTDFVKANMRVVPKKILSSGRSSAASTIVSAKHKAGSVPK